MTRFALERRRRFHERPLDGSGAQDVNFGGNRRRRRNRDKGERGAARFIFTTAASAG